MGQGRRQSRRRFNGLPRSPKVRASDLFCRWDPQGPTCNQPFFGGFRANFLVSSFVADRRNLTRCRRLPIQDLSEI